ncbi:MAG: hypothetical protein ACR65U_01335 [Methylocystis sp.]
MSGITLGELMRGKSFDTCVGRSALEIIEPIFSRITDGNRELKFQLTGSFPSEQDVRLIIAGHSHAGALQSALLAGGSDPATNAIVKALGMAALLGAPNEFYWKALLKLAPNRTVAIVWRGNDYLLDFLFMPYGFFDFVNSRRPKLQLLSPWDTYAQSRIGRMKGFVTPTIKRLFSLPRAFHRLFSWRTAACEERVADFERSCEGTLVPEQLVREHLGSSLSGLSTLIEQLKNAGVNRIFLIGTPAPRGDERSVFAYMQEEPALMELLTEKSARYKSISITPLSVRIKIWATLQDLMQEFAASCNVTFIPSPEETYSFAHGLKSEFWSNDLTHANYLYGRIAIHELGSILEEAHRDA